MRSRLFFASFLLALKCISVAVQAQPILSLDQCIVLAKKVSTDIGIANNDLASARLSLKELRAQRFPQIGVLGSASYAPIVEHTGLDPAITNEGELHAQLTIHQTVFNKGVSGLKKRQLEAELVRLGLARKIAERDIVQAVRQAYIETLRAREEEALQRQSLEQLTDYLNFVRNMYAAGNAPFTDVLKSAIDSSASNRSFEKAVEAEKLAKYQLGALIGMQTENAFDVAGSLDNLTLPRFDTVQTTFPPQTLEAKQQQASLQKSRLELQIAHREKYPDISLTADGGYASSILNLNPRFPDHVNGVGGEAGIFMTIPIIDWGAKKIHEQEQALALETLKLQMTALRGYDLAELQSLLLQVNNAKLRIGDLRETIRKAQDNFVLTKAKYASGGTPATDVLAGHKLLSDSKLEELQTRADLLQFSARIAQLLDK